MKIVIEDMLTPSVDMFQVGSLILTAQKNLVLCTNPKGFSTGRFGGVVLRSPTGLEVGKYYDGMRKEGAKLFTGSVTISNGV